MRLMDAAKAVNGKLIGEDRSFVSVSTDTRTLKAGDLFVALKGPHFNGHHYIAQAQQSGAVALLVSEPVETDLPCISVANTQQGLGALAAAWKAQFNITTVAITGSCGKTTVKEMVAAILSLKGRTLATKGNFNNEIGVPLTLMSINDQHQFAVIELGANHLGEIAYTVSLVKPDIAVITNAGSAHIEGFGSAENVAKAKGEIYQGVADGGKAVINLDDQYASYWQGLAKNSQQIGFSLNNNNADFYATGIQLNNTAQPGFQLCTPNGSVTVNLPLLGEHNVLNAITAAAVASAMGATLEQIKIGLESIKAIKGRLYSIALGSQVVIDDSYNANPVSIKAAAQMLSELPAKRCIVLGDMAELGAHAPSMHREVGVFIAEQGIDILVAKGKHAADYLAGFKQFKKQQQHCVRFDEYDEIVEFLQAESPASILIKGSRSAAMESVVDLLCESANDYKGVQ